MKILSARQFREWDAFTIAHEPISSLNLMERAAQSVTEWLVSNLNLERSIHIFCGKGNNGGDGLAMARLMIAKGYDVQTYILESGKIGTEDFQANLHQLHVFTKHIHFIQSEDAFPEIHPEDLLIDAIVGTGLNGPLSGMTQQLVEHLNQSGAEIIAIDIPSGMLADSSSKLYTKVKANATLSFQAPKCCFLAAENAAFFGRIYILNIQLHPDFLQHLATEYEVPEKEKMAAAIKKRDDFAHKGTHGHALLIAGGRGKMGAVLLAAKACLRSGVGMLTLSVPEGTDAIVHGSLPEAMVLNRLLDFDQLHTFAAIGIGPGLGTDQTCSLLVQALIEHVQKPLVLDADALNLISMHPEWLQKITPGSILTPHPKEFDRLFGPCNNDFERWEKAVAASSQYKLIILIKSHYTLIAAFGKAWFNNTGNAGLAKGGSGDVLTGIITGLLAQGYATTIAAMLGVYLHGLAADLALEKESMESMLASDLINHLGAAFYYLQDS